MTSAAVPRGAASRSVLLLLILGAVLGGGAAQLVELCTHFNHSLPSSMFGAHMTVLVSEGTTQAVSNSTPDLSGQPPTANGVSYSSFYNTANLSVSVPDLSINHTLTSKGRYRVFIETVLVHHTNSAWPGIYNVALMEQAGPGLQIDLATIIPSLFDPSVSNDLKNSVTWTHLNISANESHTLQYEAVVSGKEGSHLPKGKSFYTSTITFTDADGLQPSTIESEVCLERFDAVQESILYQHGFTALSFFVALVLGVVLVVLLLCLLLRCCPERGCLSTVAPGMLQMKKFMKKGNMLLYDAKAAMKKGFNAIKDFSMLKVDESIILILSLKDRLQMFREIDNLDILSTIHVDTDLEAEQNEVAVQTSLLLIQSLRHNGDISSQTEVKVTAEFKNRLQEIDRRMDSDYKKALEEVYKNLGLKNKERCTELMKKHEQETAEAQDKARTSTEEERGELLKLMEQQHQTEENELTYMLALEQKEEAEKLRKEFAVRKRMGIKEEQQHLLNRTCEEGQLVQQQADWLLKEHARQQEQIHRLYDEEISRQRMLLEEKLARRRALAHASEALEDDHVEMLNTMAGHQMLSIQKMRKREQLSSAQAEEYMQQVKQEMLGVKEQMEREKERQQAQLHATLSQRKQQRLADRKKQQEQEMQDYLKTSRNQQTEGAVDPVAFAEGLLKLKSLHRHQVNDLENETDSEHFHELEEVRNQIAFSGRTQLKGLEEKLLHTLQEQEGMSGSQVEKLLVEHDAEMEDLLRRQKRARDNQQNKLQEDLLRRQQEWAQRKAAEKREQEELREHEAKVVNKLINSQMSISEAERDRILKEHEKQMVQLENSLTLNKLRQKRMLEEKLVERRAQQLHRLQQKQDKEIQKHRRAAENNGEESDEETERQEVALRKKYAERRIAVMQGSELDLEQEMAQIQQEMTKDRAMVLKGQEETLGAMIAAMQLQKAREMAKIEEQQKAINTLKVNLMDELTDRGVLSNPECERIIQRHREGQEHLNKKLDTQRKKQEKSTIERILSKRNQREECFIKAQMEELERVANPGFQVIQEKLRLRLEARETSLLQRQEQEMQTLLQSSTSSTASKIRRALLAHKQMLQLEEFRNQTEREMSQVLEEMRRQHDLIKQKQLQDQELEFIAGLVKVGGVRQQELGPVLQMLYPSKSGQQLQELLDKIAQQDLQPQTTGGEEEDSSVMAGLLERVRASQLNSGLTSRQGSLRSNHGGSKKRLGGTKKRMSQISLVSSLNEDSFSGDGPKKKSRTKRGSFEAQGVSINGGFEGDGYPGRPTSSLKGLISEDYSGSYGRGWGYGVDTRDDEYPGSVGGFQHNSPIDEEDYEYPRQDEYGDDFIGMGTGHKVGGGNTQGRLPPLQTHHKSKKKKKLLKKLAHRNDEDELL